ncbi:hypothetical protein [Coxiella burnetii]|uniref:hypothetical protein n=1 Tax=Coxiella burnetii TaxID=777 RepID=UPI000509C322|nr:hypothetical protein [Coxiella burnetii]
MPRKSTCEKMTETLVRSLAVFSIFSNPETMASAKVTPLPNLNPIDCQTTLMKGDNALKTVITGFEGCPYYEELLPTFELACEELEWQDCFSFNYTSEENPRKYNPVLNTRTVQDCLGYIPFASPTLSQHLRGIAPDPLGKQILGPLNLGGGLRGDSTAEEVKKFISELPGNLTMEDSPHLRLSR